MSAPASATPPSVIRYALALAALALASCDETPNAEAPDGPAPIRAGEYRSPRVERAIEAASDVVRTRGFAELGEPWRGFLVDHAADVEERAMRTGTCYLVLAAASSAMRELNLRVFDSDGGEVMQDTTTGSMAALRYCPAQSGTYYVTIHASSGSGLFEARFFRGPTGLEIRVDDLFRSVDVEAERTER